MKLNGLIKGLNVKEIIGDIDVDVLGIQIDSKKVVKGDLFICLSGRSYDGHKFIKDVANSGAVALVVERKVETSLPQIIVKNSRKAMGKIASAFFDNPCKDLKIIGVTGTNGKTTTTHIIKNIIEYSGKRCALIGTLGVFFDNRKIETNLTTPDPIELFSIFYEIKQAGIKYVVMEVSAHSIDLFKIDEIPFEIGVFTNFTQDHLDYFETMENYKNAKLKFLTDKHCRYIVTNSDDDVGRTLIKDNEMTLSYGIDNPSDVFAIDIEEDVLGTHFIANILDKIYYIKLPLIGRFNVYNALAATVVGLLLSINAETIAKALNKIEVVSGRLELVSQKNGVFVFVDYAHTPDGLYSSINALKNIADKRVITVFGCGGNRDKSKRKIMGEISGKLSDFTVITSDNPRFEEPMEIIYEIEKGVLLNSEEYVIVQNREDAIEYAVKHAKSGDIVLVAGKGCEEYQEVLGIKRCYNDKDTINEIIKRNLQT